MIGQHVTLDGEEITVEHAIVPEHVLETESEHGIDFWHWLYFHFDQE